VIVHAIIKCYTPGMSPKKRAPKKVKKAKKASGAKKPARSKKIVAKMKTAGTKKSGGKKKTAPKVRRGAGSVAPHRKGDQHRAAHPATNLGEWSEDSGEEQDRQTTLFEDEIPPDYGGSK
jgi:hypothetical protein